MRSEAGTDLSGGSTDVALSALRGIFETLKLCHKMLLLLLLLDSHVTVAVVPGPGPELEPRAWRVWDGESLARFGLSPGLLLSATFLFVRHFLMTIVLQYKLHKCAIFAFVYAKTSSGADCAAGAATGDRLLRLTPAQPKRKGDSAKSLQQQQQQQQTFSAICLALHVPHSKCASVCVAV